MTPETKTPLAPTSFDEARLLAALPEPARAAVAPELEAVRQAYAAYETAVMTAQGAAVREMVRAAGLADAFVGRFIVDTATRLQDFPVQAPPAAPIPAGDPPPAKAAAPKLQPKLAIGVVELRVYDAVRRASSVGLTHAEILDHMYPPAADGTPHQHRAANRVPRALKALEQKGLIARKDGRVRAVHPAPALDYADLAGIAGVYVHLRSTTRSVTVDQLCDWYAQTYLGGARRGSRKYGDGKVNVFNALRGPLTQLGLVRYDEFTEGWVAPAHGDKALRKLPPVREPQAAPASA